MSTTQPTPEPTPARPAPPADAPPAPDGPPGLDRPPGPESGPEPASIGSFPPPPPLPVFPEIPRAARRETPRASSMAMAYGVALEFATYLGVCTAAGWAADTYLVGSGRRWTIFGAIFGLIGGGYRTWRGAKKLFEAMDRDDERARSGRAGPGRRGVDPGAGAGPTPPPSGG